MDSYNNKTYSHSQDAAVPQMRDATAGQSAIGLNGAGPFRFAFRQRRRIENDQVERSVAVPGKPCEGVGLSCLLAAARDLRLIPVERKIAPGAFERVSADVEVGDGLRTAARGVKGETTAETERVQYAAAGGERFHLAPVLALVEKEPGLLSAADVRLKAQPGFKKSGVGFHPVSQQDLSVRLRKPMLCGFFYISAQPQHDSFGLQFFTSQTDDSLESRQPGGRVKFQHERRAVAVKHQPRPAVALAVDPAIAGRLCVE